MSKNGGGGGRSKEFDQYLPVYECIYIYIYIYTSEDLSLYSDRVK